MRGVRLTTERLLVRDLPPLAAGRVAQFHRENWDFHRQWEPYRRGEYFRAPLQRRILRSEAAADAALHLWMLLREPEGARCSRSWRRMPIVGSITLSSIIRGSFANCVLGYKVGAPYARRGYTREALCAVIDHVFASMKLHRIEANVMPSNLPSLELLRGLGFREEGLARRYLRIQGVWEDHLRMVMLCDEWCEKTLRG
jgi:[ribosomal protein S5]-alanine N-acetyltransferase